MVTMSFLEAQDTIKIISDNLQIAEQRYNEGVKLLESGNIQGAINKFTGYKSKTRFVKSIL